MANIKDVAKMAGVSVTTVSRVLNDYPYVSAEKAEAVRKAMEECNYQRNINAVHLSKGKTFLVGVVVPFSNHPYFGLLIDGIANAALTHNYKLVLIQTNYEEEKEIEALTMLKNKQIDALIICSRICDWKAIKDFTQYGPIVLCEDAREKEVSCTFVDHYKSFSIALDYLHKKGHSRIGYCIGRKSGTNSKQRHSAYVNFLKENSLSFHSDFIFSGCFNFEDGVKVVTEFVQMKERPTALLVTSDQVAAGILTCCKEQGIFIPEDLAIMGFDNQPISKVMHITTLEIPLVEVGRKLFHQAMDGERVTHEEIPVKLIERETV
ncbi:LacI family DNA-binding transcriptional regulator [Fictibacillus phosphorivorans]|uniref:LacI family DNA-binding transcriptional regulator n=1 Tax=Fictibacillus phosphorivorans TaxID=1221500 RepID=UPI00203CE332|nr:LacI family DNA-binding transcriptional regulator [Fictibacillus phosphorivorans]MCM3719920.1 LacI family DNA-binding transcriptional regulator [Fictibacillus phosphorivorans]MCM3777626.1 LacI family DNA-binding transcriptional regulator [Fictibacillus phosphorivorans]